MSTRFAFPRRRGYPAALLLVALRAACTRTAYSPAPPSSPHLVFITIDTLRADRVGAYGYAAARTPAIDALAARGTRFEKAYATAPITLTSHASLLSGRYPAGHGARHNGVPLTPTTPLLAEALARNGFVTAAFVAAFPLDRRFGLDRGFQTYSDRMPRVNGRLSSERPAGRVVTEAIEWLAEQRASSQGNGPGKFFLWIHMFEPHAPYGVQDDGRPVAARYDDEIAAVDREIARVVAALEADLERTTFIVTSDHGEAFGEHGEVAHSIFVYDTTLRVPLVVAGPGISRGVVDTPVSLIDVAPTIAGLTGLNRFDADGTDLRPALEGRKVHDRELYAESFAPLLDFGWSPLRSIREGGWKFIDAPRPELYHTVADPSEGHDRSPGEPARVTSMRDRVGRYSAATVEAAPTDPEAASRLRSLGYVGGGRRGSTASRPDPKDRRELAASIARVTSGELRGRELEGALWRILAADPANPQMNMRLGFVLQESKRCTEAMRYFDAAIKASAPGADPHLGRAGCLAADRQFDEAAAALRQADEAEPGNPVVVANLGIVLSDRGRPGEGIPLLQRALTLDPEFHEARFNLAVAFARDGRRDAAAREAQDLLNRLSPDAPQRPEVERLLKAVR